MIYYTILHDTMLCYPALYYIMWRALVQRFRQGFPPPGQGRLAYFSNLGLGRKIEVFSPAPTALDLSIAAALRLVRIYCCRLAFSPAPTALDLLAAV